MPRKRRITHDGHHDKGDRYSTFPKPSTSTFGRDPFHVRPDLSLNPRFYG
jgi:hypothetical protein